MMIKRALQWGMLLSMLPWYVTSTQAAHSPSKVSSRVVASFRPQRLLPTTTLFYNDPTFFYGWHDVPTTSLHLETQSYA